MTSRESGSAVLQFGFSCPPTRKRVRNSFRPMAYPFHSWLVKTISVFCTCSKKTSCVGKPGLENWYSLQALTAQGTKLYFKLDKKYHAQVVSPLLLLYIVTAFEAILAQAE